MPNKMTFSSLEETLVEKRCDEMISPCGGNSIARFAHFLKPSCKPTSNLHPCLNPTKPHFLNLHNSPSRVVFHGWKSPLKVWSSWVESLRPEFEPLWRKTSIDQAIKASTFHIPRHKDLIFALAQRFCPDTNTFVFPWGEASITLEDVMVLGGFSVTGDSVLSTHSSEKLCDSEDSLRTARKEILSCNCKPRHRKWVEKWMGRGCKFEHEAFLSLWLSRCVFASDINYTVTKNVFPIAALLAKGTKLALAPAVLASIYRDLRLLKEKIESLNVENDDNMTSLSLWSPLLLLQLWVWERFPMLSPKPNPITTIGQPRIARWHMLRISKNDNDDVGFALDSAKKCFIWRPYTKPLNNWSLGVKIYPEKECWVVVGSDVDLDLESYVRCIRVSELVGLDCTEQYHPHRVSMQFGLDQDVPISIPMFNGDHNSAWSNYNRPIRVRNGKLYLPSRHFESDVTTQYLQWWKDLSIAKRYTASVLKIKLEDNEEVGPPRFVSPNTKAIENVSSDDSYESDNEPITQKFKALRDCGVEVETDHANPTPRSTTQMKGVEPQDDSDCEDHLTLKQFFCLNKTKLGNSGCAFKVGHSESPSSSAGDNTTIKFSKSHIEPVKESENSKRGSRYCSQSRTGSPMKSPMCTNKKEGKTGLGHTPKCGEGDLLSRIDRVKRLVDMVKAAKLGKE